MTTLTPTTGLFGFVQTTAANWRMTISNALIITRREVRDSFRDWRIIAPIVILTFFFPFLAQWTASRFSSYLANYGAPDLGERFMPFLLMVVGFFPISISLVIALETFVGEKERRSLEPLLSTPLSNTELYIGKTLAAMIPPLMASFGGMSFYLVTLYLRNAPWQPGVVITLQIFVLTIVQALVMVTGSVVVSSQTTSTRAANLLASLIIIPMTLLVNAESVIIFLAPDADSGIGIKSLWMIAFGMVVTAILLMRVGNSIFNREELLGRSIDSLNPVGIVKKMWRYVRAVDDEGTTAGNLLQWYTRSIPYSLRKMKTPILVTIGVFVVYFTAGYIVGQFEAFQLPLTKEWVLSEDILSQTEGFGPLGEDTAFILIVLQNSRVLLLALILSTFSFGVMAYAILPVVFAALGYIASQLIPVGLGSLLAAAVLPHGIVEIPTTILATAVIFRLGAIVTKPPENQTVGHAWIVAFGDSVKLGVGLIIPGLLLGGLIEAYVTFDIVNRILANLA